MRYKTMSILMILCMICLLASCGRDAYLKTISAEKEEAASEKNTQIEEDNKADDEGITAGEGKTSDEGVSADEEAAQGEDGASDEKTDASGEDRTDSAMELIPDDGKAYIYHTEMVEYDAEVIVPYLFGEDYDYTESADSATGMAVKLYESGQKQLLLGAGTGMRFKTNRISNCYPDPAMYAGTPVLSYQKAHVSCLFPEDPESRDGYEDAEKACDTAADAMDFLYTAREVYYIDYEFLTEVLPRVSPSGGPMWAEENQNNGPGERTASYWNEDETAFLFIYRMENIEGIQLGAVMDENIMTVLYSPKYGIVQISCPKRYEVIGKEETEIKDADSIDQEFWLTAATLGLQSSDIEIVSKVLVYSSYEEYWSESMEKDLRPYWKVSFRGAGTDKELEDIMIPIGVFRGEEQSEWYFMIPALSE